MEFLVRSLPDDSRHPHCEELLEVDAAHRAEVARLTGLLEECNAVCLCGCPAGEHESYGEDGESCGKDDHECLRVAPAVSAAMEKERAARREAEEKLEMSRKSIVFTWRDFMRAVETLYVPADVKGNTLAEVLNTLLEERLEMRAAHRAEVARLQETLEEALARCEKCGGYKPAFWCDECREARAALAPAPKEDDGE